MTIKSLLASASALAFALAAGAACADTAPADNAQPVSGVTVTPMETQAVPTAPTAPPLQSAYSVGTITNENLRNDTSSPDVTIQTILNDQPSIMATTSGPFGVESNITFRAFDAGQFAETFDGIEINDVFNSAVTSPADTENTILLTVPDIDSVEIYRGVNNPSVNAYNSLGGTINFIPRQPSDTMGATIAGSYGSYNTYDYSGTVDTGQVHGLKDLFSFTEEHSDDWYHGLAPDSNLNLYDAFEFDAPNGDRLSGFAVYNHNIGNTIFYMPVQLLSAAGGFDQYPLSDAYEEDHDTNALGLLDFSTNPDSNISFDSKFYAGENNYLRTSYANPADRQSSTQPYYQPSDAEDFNFWSGSSTDCATVGSTECDHYPAGPTYLNGVTSAKSVEDGTDYHFYGYTAFALGYTPTLTVKLPNNTVVVGGNVTFGELNSREYWYGSQPVPQVLGYNDAWNEWDQRLLASVYIQDTISLFSDRLTITPGVKYIFAYTTDNDAIGIYYPFGGQPRAENQFISPTIGVNYKITPDLAVYAAFGQNFMLPQISALYDGIVADYVPGVTTAANATSPVTLKPEYVNDYELGVRYEHGGFDGMLNVYREDFTNTFVDAYNETLGDYTYTNGGTSTYQGVELQVIEDLGEKPWGDLKGQASFAYNQAQFTSSFYTDYGGIDEDNADVLVHAGTPLADVPNYLVSAGLIYSWQGWRAQIDGHYVGSQFVNQDMTGVTGDTKLPSYITVNLKVSKTFDLAGSSDRPLKSIKIGIDARNLFNEYYFVSGEEESIYHNGDGLYAIPGAPRTILGTVEVKF